MTVEMPTTQQIADGIIAQEEAQFSATVPRLLRSFISVTAKVLGGYVVILHKYAGWIFLQQFTSTASMQETSIAGKTVKPLVELGRRIGVDDPRPAVASELRIAVDVIEQTGTLTAYTQLLRTQSGVVYEVAFDVALSASTVQATVRPISDPNGGDGSGTVGNLAVGDKLQFAQPPSNVQREATVTQVIVTGADAETRDAYEARINSKNRAKPQGGAYADYRQWGADANGIANIYPYRGSPGEIDIYVEATTASYGSADGIPNQSQLDAVKNSILYEESLDIATGLATRSPVNDWINTFPIYRTAFGVRIFGTVDPVLRDQIEDGVDEYFRSREPFIMGLTALPREDAVTPNAVGAVVEAIVTASGGSVTSVELLENGGTSNGRLLSRGEKAKAGTVQLPGD